MAIKDNLDDFKYLASDKVSNAKHAFSSWAAFKQWVQVPETALDVHGAKRWSNEDLDPTPPEKRNWRLLFLPRSHSHHHANLQRLRWYNYVVFYWALSCKSTECLCVVVTGLVSFTTLAYVESVVKCESIGTTFI